MVMDALCQVSAEQKSSRGPSTAVECEVLSLFNNCDSHTTKQSLEEICCKHSGIEDIPEFDTSSDLLLKLSSLQHQFLWMYIRDFPSNRWQNSGLASDLFRWMAGQICLKKQLFLAKVQ